MAELMKQVTENLHDLNNGSVQKLEEPLLSSLISHVTLDKPLVAENIDQVKLLLHAITQVLENNSLSIEYALIVELLDSTLSQMDYDTISQLFELDYILEALSSPNETVQTIALKVVSKAQPVDILANTAVVPRVVELLLLDSASVKTVSEIEKTLEVLFRGELIRRRVLDDGVRDLLLQMKRNKNAVIVSRFLDIMVLLLPSLSVGEAPSDLYRVDVILDEDILLTLNIIKYYTNILDIIDSNLNKEWLLEDIWSQIEEIADLYSRKSENVDIGVFAVSIISELFEKVSRVSPSTFEVLDKKYIHLKKDDTHLLATLNSAYLAKIHSTLIRSISLTMDNLPIICNLISDASSFTIIQPQLTSSAILRLPYLEIMTLTCKLTQFAYSAQYLLTDLPQVMNKLLKGDNVIESETWKLRKLTLEQLLRLPHEILDVWHASVLLEYEKITQGKRFAPQIEVLDDLS